MNEILKREALQSCSALRVIIASASTSKKLACARVEISKGGGQLSETSDWRQVENCQVGDVREMKKFELKEYK